MRDQRLLRRRGRTSRPGVAVGLLALAGVAAASCTTGPPSPPLPTASVARPVSGERVSGTAILDATTPNATGLTFRLFGGSIGHSGLVLCNAGSSHYGWVCKWNSMTVPNGRYVLRAQVTNPRGTALSPGVRFTVKNR